MHEKLIEKWADICEENFFSEEDILEKSIQNAVDAYHLRQIFKDKPSYWYYVSEDFRDSKPYQIIQDFAKNFGQNIEKVSSMKERDSVDFYVNGKLGIDNGIVFKIVDPISKIIDDAIEERKYPSLEEESEMWAEKYGNSSFGRFDEENEGSNTVTSIFNKIQNNERKTNMNKKLIEKWATLCEEDDNLNGISTSITLYPYKVSPFGKASKKDFEPLTFQTKEELLDFLKDNECFANSISESSWTSFPAGLIDDGEISPDEAGIDGYAEYDAYMLEKDDFEDYNEFYNLCDYINKNLPEWKGEELPENMEKVEDFPDYAADYLSYLEEYGKKEADESFKNLDQEDIENIMDFMKDSGYSRIVKVYDDSKVGFNRYPVFGLPCSTVTAVFEKGNFNIVESKETAKEKHHLENASHKELISYIGEDVKKMKEKMEKCVRDVAYKFEHVSHKEMMKKYKKLREIIDDTTKKLVDEIKDMVD